MRDRDRGQHEVVREEDQSLLGAGIDIVHAAQWGRIVTAAVCRRQDDDVIRMDARREIDRPRRSPREPNALLRARHEEGRLLGEAIEAREVDVCLLYTSDAA